jgi:MoxR-like ATPase
LVDFTRTSPRFDTGLSPRAALALVHGARAWAYLQGRDLVLPEDVQAVMDEVAGHRLRLEGGRQSLQALLLSVPIP